MWVINESVREKNDSIYFKLTLKIKIVPQLSILLFDKDLSINFNRKKAYKVNFLFEKCLNLEICLKQ